MFLAKMVATEGISAVVPVAAIISVREHDVFMLVVTNPVAAAFRLYKILGLTT
jgi:acyl-CoA hydrolase